MDILYASAVRAAALSVLQKDVSHSYLKVYCDSVPSAFYCVALIFSSVT